MTVCGTDAAPELLEIVMTLPVAPAGPFNVTVAVEVEPPETVVGLSESPVNDEGSIVRFADAV